MSFARVSRHWPKLLAVYLGVLAGVGLYTFLYAKGYSYLTDDPRVSRRARTCASRAA